MVTIHIMAIGYCVYMFYTVLRGYLAGGPNAPSLATLILGGLILLGGAAGLGYFSFRMYRNYKKSQQADSNE